MMEALAVDAGGEVAELIGVSGCQLAFGFQALALSIPSFDLSLTSTLIEKSHVTAM